MLMQTTMGKKNQLIAGGKAMDRIAELERAIIYFSYASTAADHTHAVDYGEAVLSELPPLASLTPQERELALELAYKTGNYSLIKKFRQQQDKQ